MVVLALNTGAQASVVVSAVSGSASSEIGGPFSIKRTFDQSGLSLGYTSGVTNFDSYMSSNPTHTFFADGREWFAKEGVPQVQITYDLGKVHHINKMALWSEDSGGIHKAILSSSTDGEMFHPVLTVYPSNPPINTAYGAEVFSLVTPAPARFVRLDLTCQHTGGFNGCSLGEIAFSAVQPRSLVQAPFPQTDPPRLLIGRNDAPTRSIKSTTPSFVARWGSPSARIRRDRSTPA